MPSAIEIELKRTPGGGWTRKQLAAWGVSWPPPKGWRKRLEREYELTWERRASEWPALERQLDVLLGLGLGERSGRPCESPDTT